MIEINNEFWNNFWANFLSSVLTGIIFSFVITFIIKILRKPKLKICLSVGTNVKGHSLIFYCVNTGSVGVMPNELQWNIYFPLALQPSDSFKEKSGALHIGFEPYNVVNGFNEKPCLPGDSIMLIYIPIELKEGISNFTNQKFESVEKAKYYYSLATTKGQKKYHNFFWDYFNKTKYIEDSTFVKRPIIEIKDKIL